MDNEHFSWAILPVMLAAGLPLVLFRDWITAPGDINQFLLYCALILQAVASAYTIFWGLCFIFYRVFPKKFSEAELPECTVLVPAYNEGEHVAKTLRSLLKSDYPAEKLHIFAINDGSKDDTWEWITRCVTEADGRIRGINIEKNGGKKHALAVGVREAPEGVVVTVDSDSLVYPDTLRELVAPLADPRVGAVAGNLVAENRRDGVFARMLDTVLVFGCNFVRGAQSATGCVVCTPGALSAYRRGLLAGLLDEWLNQTFLGEPANIGEDRAITTLILRENYRVVYQRSAQAETTMPASYPTMCKMLIRWTRSDIRENFRMLEFLCLPGKNISLGRRLLLWIQWVPLMLNVILPVIGLPMIILTVAITPNLTQYLEFYVLSLFVASLLPTYLYAKRRGWKAAPWAMLYTFFSPIGVLWICFWSFFTMRNSRWLTREIKAPAVADTRQAASGLFPAGNAVIGQNVPMER